jgi:hypothetical protein
VKLIPIILAAIFAAVGSSSCVSLRLNSEQSTISDHDKRKTIMTQHATGTFDVKLLPLALNESGDGDTRGRMSINKQFHGDLEATSVGEMLTAMTSVKGSAGYVAIERVTGSLHARKGSFALQHSGTMTRGEPSLSVTVVPDSGTDELAGISGKLAIIISEGKHSYEFEYLINAE